MSPRNPVVSRAGGPASLSGGELLAVMKRLASAERTLSVYALAHLAEIQRRKLYEDAGYSTMFAYCLGELRYSESNTCRRLLAADAARKFPETLSLIKSGGITVCSLALVAKHLTRENCADLLKRVEGKSLRTVERLVAELAPRPDTRDTIRSLPPSARSSELSGAWLPVKPPAAALPAAALPAAALPAADLPAAALPAAEPPAIEPLAAEPAFLEPSASRAELRPAFPRPSQKIMPRSPERVLFSFTGSEELRRVIDRCGELMWHKYPAGRLEDVILELGKNYLKLKDPELLPPSAPKAARSAESRYIPRWVRSKVYRRDGGRCAFTSVEGRRCESRRGLEYDHVLPWSKGGRSDDPDNIRLLCRAHNLWSARAAGLA